MVCVFCDSEFHRSQKCEKYKTEKARKNCPNSNRICFSCYFESDEPHLQEDVKCKSSANCISWLSSEHHLFFCKERIKVFFARSLFLPKLDQDLISQFFEIIDIDEKYVIMLLSSTTKFKQMKVMNEFDEKKFKKRSNSDIFIVNHIMKLTSATKRKHQHIFDAISSKTLICLAKIIDLDKCQLSGEMVLQLLSTHTEEFSMVDTFCNPNLSFTDIIKKAPNLVEFSFYNFYENIIYEDSWIEDLIKYKKGKHFDHLDIMLDTVAFDVEQMVEFIKTKCNKDVKIDITFKQPSGDEEENWEALEELAKKLAVYFYHDYELYGNKEAFEGGHLHLGYDGADSDADETFLLTRFKKF